MNFKINLIFKITLLTAVLLILSSCSLFKTKSANINNILNNTNQNTKTNLDNIPPALPAPVPTEIIYSPKWQDFNSSELNYVLKYPLDFFFVEPLAESFACDVASFDKKCPVIDEEGDVERKNIADQSFCIRSIEKVALGTDHVFYQYISVNGDKCSVLKLQKDYPACFNYDSNSTEYTKCEEQNNIIIPMTIREIENSFQKK